MEAIQGRQDIYGKIVGLTPGWVEARDKAERAAHLDSNLNRQERDAIAPINRLLESLNVVELEQIPIQVQEPLEARGTN